MIASFPWYDLPSVQWANDALWQSCGQPGALNRRMPIEAQWRDPDLFVTQACGLDLFLSDAPIEAVAAPVFDLDCQPGSYYSYIVGTRRTGTAAVNSVTSRSGCSALLSHCEPDELLITGSHLLSIEAIRAHRADVAAIDAVTWHIIARDEPHRLSGIRILERTSEAPSPPFVTHRGGDREGVFDALQRAFLSPRTLPARQALLLRDVTTTRLADYQSVHEEYLAVAGIPAARSGTAQSAGINSTSRPRMGERMGNGSPCAAR